MGMGKYVFFVMGCLFAVFFSCGCLEDSGGRVITMTVGEFIGDYNFSVDTDARVYVGWYNSLDEGDTLVLNDTISVITYHENVNFTAINFETLLNYDFEVEGNITGMFGPGDTVEIRVHIIGVRYNAEVPPLYDIWVFERETIKEGWDSESNRPVPVPQEHIRGV